MTRVAGSVAEYEGAGPFLASGLRSGDRYELSNGHAFYCAPRGADVARAILVGAQVLGTDPAVTEAGIDAGYSFGPRHLRAPDIAIGNVPDLPGWIAGAPPLAVEYAGSGQDEAKLQEKIADLIGAGTRWIWVVRLLGPRRVEIHEADVQGRILACRDLALLDGWLERAIEAKSLADVMG